MSKSSVQSLFIIILFCAAVVLVVVLWSKSSSAPAVETKPDAGIVTDAGVSGESKEPPAPVADPAKSCTLVQLKSPGEFISVCTKIICPTGKPTVEIANAYTDWDNAAAQFALQTPAGIACAQGSCPTAQWAPAGSACPLFVLTGTLRMLPPKQPTAPELAPIAPTPKKALPKK